MFTNFCPKTCTVIVLEQLDVGKKFNNKIEFKGNFVGCCGVRIGCTVGHLRLL